MKILYINNLLNGGAANAIRLVAKGGRALGVEPILAVSANKTSIETVDNYKVYQIKIPNLYGITSTHNQAKWKKPLWHLLDSYNVFSKKAFIKIIKKEKPDIIHTNNYSGFSPYIWKIAYKLGIPVIHTIQDYSLLCTRAIMYKKTLCTKQCISCKCFSIPKKYLSKYVHSVVGVSNNILQTHLNLGFFKNAIIKTNINNPIELKQHNIKTKQEKTITFSFVGLLAPIKGIDFLLNIFSKNFKDNAILNIWGKGYTTEFENAIREKYKQANIIFKGYGKHDEIYSQTDALIVPAMWHEPFGLIIPEANSYGVPVIASNRGAFTETVQNGKNGFLFDPEKADSLIKAIQKFIDTPNLANSMNDHCKEFASSCDYKTVASQYVDIYKKVLT